MIPPRPEMLPEDLLEGGADPFSLTSDWLAGD
jgi:hypothetical protein